MAEFKNPIQWEAGYIEGRNDCITEILRLLRQELAFQEAYATPLEDMDTGILCGLSMALQKAEGLQRDKNEDQLQMEIQED